MDFSNITRAWPSIASLAEDISDIRGEKISVHCVQKWRERNNIPDCFWLDLIKIAPKVNLKISIEQLADISREKSLVS